MADEHNPRREWAVAKVVESPEEAAFVVGFLESSGVPAEAESLYVEELPVHLGSLGEVRVRVPPERLHEALDLLARQDAAPPPPPEADEAAAETSGETGPQGGGDPSHQDPDEL